MTALTHARTSWRGVKHGRRNLSNAILIKIAKTEIAA